MDDLPKSVILVTLCQEMIQVMKKGGFNLTKFKNNSDRVLEALQNDKYKKATQDFEVDAERVEKTLRVSWKIQDHVCLYLYKKYESI